VATVHEANNSKKRDGGFRGYSSLVLVIRSVLMSTEKQKKNNRKRSRKGMEMDVREEEGEQAS
jgi:hypothetical protein